MNSMTKFRNGVRTTAQKLFAGAALSLAVVGSAMAAADPTAPILAAIETGKGYGIAVAVALVGAGFAIGAIYMARKRS